MLLSFLKPFSFVSGETRKASALPPLGGRTSLKKHARQCPVSLQGAGAVTGRRALPGGTDLGPPPGGTRQVGAGALRFSAAVGGWKEQRETLREVNGVGANHSPRSAAREAFHGDSPESRSWWDSDKA